MSGDKALHGVGMRAWSLGGSQIRNSEASDGGGPMAGGELMRFAEKEIGPATRSFLVNDGLDSILASGGERSIRHGCDEWLKGEVLWELSGQQSRLRTDAEHRFPQVNKQGLTERAAESQGAGRKGSEGRKEGYEGKLADPRECPPGQGENTSSWLTERET